MAIMDRLAKLDSSMQRGLDNSMAALFGGKVVPAEVEELLKQETQDSLIMTDRDELIAPNVFAVGVSSKDLENLSQDRSLPALLADQLTRFVRNQGWSFEGPAVVRIAEESGLRTGQLRCPRTSTSNRTWQAASMQSSPSPRTPLTAQSAPATRRMQCPSPPPPPANPP